MSGELVADNSRRERGACGVLGGQVVVARAFSTNFFYFIEATVPNYVVGARCVPAGLVAGRSCHLL